MPKDMSIDFEPYKEGDKTVLATPEQYGFMPKFLTKKAKVNHTPNAAVGFSMAITRNEENSTASLDLSKFAGKAINVAFYLKAENAEKVIISMMDGTENEIVSADIDAEWTYVAFSYKFDEAEGTERQLIIKGSGADDFDLDEMVLTMVEDKDMVETVVRKDGEELEHTQTTDVEEMIENNSNGNKWHIWAILGVGLGVLVLACGLIVVRKKNK